MKGRELMKKNSIVGTVVTTMVINAAAGIASMAGVALWNCVLQDRFCNLVGKLTYKNKKKIGF